MNHISQHMNPFVTRLYPNVVLYFILYVFLIFFVIS